MQRFAVLTYGVVVYAFFFLTFLYAIGFVTGIVVPRTIDEPALFEVSGAAAWLVNIGILGLFGIQHTIMARKGFKNWLTRFIPKAAERSTFVLVTCLILNLLYIGWQPMTGVVWDVQNQALASVLIGVSLLGWGIVLLATFLINHFHLFGLHQVWSNFTDGGEPPKKFVTPMLYKVTRHPLYLGFFIAFWAAPTMTVGHLLYALITTTYVVFEVVFFEEPDLVRDFKTEYPLYQRTVRMFLPLPKRSKGGAKPSAVTA
ncbi:MAG: methanethiol S-methyltransferase [Planctomycetota bacterium]|jgi:protein-S-isoprenylcysteine O-methyltransferase Ste14